jgi:hypothetical protein
MHYFSNLLWFRTLDVSDRSTVHHQESQHTTRSNKIHNITFKVLYQSTFEKQCNSLAFITRIDYALVLTTLRMATLVAETC